MRKKIDDIEIKEPPLEELGKKHSCFKRTCVSCCSFFLVLGIGSFIVLTFAMGPKTKELKTVPPIVLSAVPMYDAENSETVIITSGQERSRGVETAAFVPKLVISPFIIAFDKHNSFLKKYQPDLLEAFQRERALWGKFLLFMKQPVGDHRDMVTINWFRLNADRDFIAEYYETELKKKDFSILTASVSPNVTQFAFAKDNIDGIVYIEDNPTTRYTDKVELVITMDVEK